MDLRTRLRRPDWQTKRQEAFRAYGRKCAVCGATRRLQVHHLHYKTLGRESVGDFRILCKKCHKKGRYSAWEISRDHASLVWLHAIEWLFFLPFRLLWSLTKMAWGLFTHTPKSID